MRASIIYYAAVILCLALMGARSASAGDKPPAPGAHVLLADFADGWDASWEVRKFSRRANETLVHVNDDGDRSLEFVSESAASGIWRKFHVEPLTNGRLSWRWKVERALSANIDERSKDGDDFAARVFVVFTRPFLPWKARAVCYVWAGNERQGSRYRNPYAKNVAMVVLRTGNDAAGEWVFEERDVVADYIDSFGEPPKEIRAFAVMVDTDDTRARARAWFDDLTFFFE